MTQKPHSEQLEIPLDIHPDEGGISLSTAAEMALDILNNVRYPSELRRRKELSGGTLTKMAFRQEITMDEYYLLMSAKEAKRADLVASDHSSIPEDIPESPNIPVPPEQQAPWSPTDILKTMPAEREFDARELAAGEHLDRD